MRRRRAPFRALDYILCRPILGGFLAAESRRRSSRKSFTFPTWSHFQRRLLRHAGLFLFTCERPTIVSRAGVVVALAKQWGCSAEAMRGRCYSRSGVHSSYPPERCTTPLKEPLLIRTHPVQGLAPAQTCL